MVTCCEINKSQKNNSNLCCLVTQSFEGVDEKFETIKSIVDPNPVYAYENENTCRCNFFLSDPGMYKIVLLELIKFSY